MRRPSGIIFDLGETVLRLKSFNPVAGNGRLLEFATSTLGLTAKGIQLVADEMSREVNQIRDKSMIEFGCQSFHRLLFETLGISFSISYPELEREFWHAAVTYVPTEGILDVLDTLEANRIKAGILSNTSFTGAVLEEELAKHNLAHRFSFVISSADYGFRKPHNRIFRVAVKKMNIEPHDIWFVGDKLEDDIRGAIDCGLYPVWYNPQNEPSNVNYEYLEVRNWHEFGEKIESLCSH